MYKYLNGKQTKEKNNAKAFTTQLQQMKSMEIFFYLVLSIIFVIKSYYRKMNDLKKIKE